MSLQLLIELQGVANPTVWRRVVVPESASFEELHFLIQLVFGWENEHLYEFANNGPKSLSGFREPVFIEPAEDSGSMFSMFGPTLGKKSVDSSKARVGDFFLKPSDFMVYTYDFGDNWEHKVTLESIDQNALEAPDLIDGAGLCPPEDCGGFPGWDHLKKAMTRLTEDDMTMLEWYYGWSRPPKRFSPNKWDEKGVRKALKEWK